MIDWRLGRRGPGETVRWGGLTGHPAWTCWGAHIFFWLAYFGVRTAAAGADPPKEEFSDFPFLANRALAVLTYFVLTGALLALVQSAFAKRSALMRNLALIFGALALSPLTLHGEELWPQMLMPDMAPTPVMLLPAYLFQFGWVLALWGFTQVMLQYHFQTVAQARDIARAQTLAHDAQLRMLHYQINPHFLFNTLNAISTLVLDKRTELAERMLLRLSGFLRYSLDRQPNELVALSAEIEAQRKYLEIEQIRFGDKLTIRFDIEPGLETVRLPSLILQPILENAVKHAVTPSAGQGSIDLKAYRDGEVLRISVDDDGPGISLHPTSRRGLGLANARERLLLLYGDKAGLTTENRDPRGCRIEIWLPLEEERSARATAPILG